MAFHKLLLNPQQCFHKSHQRLGFCHSTLKDTTFRNRFFFQIEYFTGYLRSASWQTLLFFICWEVHHMPSMCKTSWRKKCFINQHNPAVNFEPLMWANCWFEIYRAISSAPLVTQNSSLSDDSGQISSKMQKWNQKSIRLWYTLLISETLFGTLSLVCQGTRTYAILFAVRFHQQLLSLLPILTLFEKAIIKLI